jgi:hypothetical protein
MTVTVSVSVSVLEDSVSVSNQCQKANKISLEG